MHQNKVEDIKGMFRKAVLFLFLLLCVIDSNFAGAESNNQRTRTVTIEEFLKVAIENDAVFEEILIDELTLKYSKDLQLPAKDIILSVKGQYESNITQDTDDSQATVSLSKLFQYIGTDISAEYKTTPSYSEAEDSSEITVLISQPIAKNAFGRANVLLSKIIGSEIDVTRYQIVEAYEDYLAAVMIAYYNWYSAYENLKIGESSYEQSTKLLKNIEQRRKSNIALPIDVNKVRIQTLSKKENLIALEENYEGILNFIKQAMRYKGDEILEPTDPFMYNKRDILFEEDYERFMKTSRTYRILNLLEKKSSLEVKRDANSLLPSTNLLFGYVAEGEDIDIKNREEMLYVGMSIVWPFPGQQERAQYETSKITKKKTILANENKYIQLETDLRNLYIQIEREKKLISTAEEKIALAESILKDETINYSYGKVTLNDFIDAVNLVDENKFNKIIHSVQLKILVTEWMRLTDQLISRKDIKK